jgi:DNA-binding transcriptional ArsR family regulator
LSKFTDLVGRDTGTAPEDTPRAHRPLTRPTILPVAGETMDDGTWRLLRDHAQEASDFLKAISHEGRLMILCSLADGEKSVTEIEQLLSSRQAAISQQLARLRLEGLVTARREGKQIFYSLTDDRARRIIEHVYELFAG